MIRGILIVWLAILSCEFALQLTRTWLRTTPTWELVGYDLLIALAVSIFWVAQFLLCGLIVLWFAGRAAA